MLTKIQTALVILTKPPRGGYSNRAAPTMESTAEILPFPPVELRKSREYSLDMIQHEAGGLVTIQGVVPLSMAIAMYQAVQLFTTA